jgi:hypothetical protein
VNVATGVARGSSVAITVPNNAAVGSYSVRASCFLYSSTLTFDPATFIVTASNVGALKTPGGTVTITSPTGTNLSGLTENAVPAGAPTGVSFPYGLLGFSVSGVPSGGTEQITIAVPSSVTQYWKYQRGVFTRFSGASFATGKVVLTLTDGGAGDEDGVANGRIVEPGAPGIGSAVPTATAPTPVVLQPRLTG